MPIPTYTDNTQALLALVVHLDQMRTELETVIDEFERRAAWSQ